MLIKWNMANHPSSLLWIKNRVNKYFSGRKARKKSGRLMKSNRKKIESKWSQRCRHCDHENEFALVECQNGERTFGFDRRSQLWKFNHFHRCSMKRENCRQFLLRHTFFDFFLCAFFFRQVFALKKKTYAQRIRSNDAFDVILLYRSTMMNMYRLIACPLFVSTPFNDDNW